jgi:hypothetical protein
MKPLSDQFIICSLTCNGKELKSGCCIASSFELPMSNHARDFLSGKSLLEIVDDGCTV